MKNFIIPGILLLISGTGQGQAVCPPTDNINYTISTAITKQASVSITASSVVNPSNDAVNYHAGSFVQLDPGFNTDITSSGSFTASIVTCVSAAPRTSGGNAMPPTKEVAPVSGLSVYPNPANNILFIQLPQHAKVLSVEILDAQGRLMPVVPTQGATPTVNISKLAAGNYFLKVNVKGNSYSTMFIKQ
jgi:Secretion system C-terminal sorting domain